MKKLFTILLCLLLCSTATLAQAKVSSTARTPANPLQRLLTTTGLPFTVMNDSLAAIPYKSEIIPSYEVLIQKISDLYIIYTNLSAVVPGKIDDTKFKYLLQQSDNFDIIKIGMGSENTVFVRADVYRTNLTGTLLARVIKQVGNVTSIIAGDLSSNK